MGVRSKCRGALPHTPQTHASYPRHGSVVRTTGQRRPCHLRQASLVGAFLCPERELIWKREGRRRPQLPRPGHLSPRTDIVREAEPFLWWERVRPLPRSLPLLCHREPPDWRHESEMERRRSRREQDEREMGRGSTRSHIYSQEKVNRRPPTISSNDDPLCMQHAVVKSSSCRGGVGKRSRPCPINHHALSRPQTVRAHGAPHLPFGFA